MAILEFILLLLACVLVSSVIDQFVPKLSLPLIQIALGVAISLISGGDYNFFVNNDLFMALFVVPLLFNEARKVNKEVLLRNPVTIVSLAVGLVLFITLSVGFSLNILMSTVPLAAAFALGAALGPTDAIAVSSLPEDANLGTRREGILQGECLINDASGIVAFQCAIIAVTTGTFSITDAAADFAWLFIGGTLIGISFGILFNFVRKWMQNLTIEGTTFHVLLELLFPFIVYFAAETFHMSGIIAVAIAGIVISVGNSPNKWINPEISRLNIASTSVWDVFIFALNGVVFIMLGVMLPTLVETSLPEIIENNFSAILYVFVITIVLFSTRFIWLLVAECVHNKSKGKRSLLSKGNVRSALIMTFGGAKGAVTMAIMFTIPIQLADGTAFPERQLLLLIAGNVIIVTLILANFILPLLIPKHEKEQLAARAESNEELAKITIQILRRVIEDLNSMTNDKNRAAIQNVINSYAERISQIKKNNNFSDKLNIEYRKKVYEWERAFIAEQVNKGNVNADIANKYLRHLNMKEDLLEHHTSATWKLRNNILRSKNMINLLPERTKNMVQGEYANPGETMKFSTKYINSRTQPINAMNELKKACYNHIVKRIDEEMHDSAFKSEDMTNIMNDYQKQLETLKDKSHSLSTLKTINDQILKYTRMGLQLELDYIQEAYDNKQITGEQFKTIYDQVLLIQVSMEKF